MILTDVLKRQFTEKLHKTGSFDEAFTKAVWAAYLHGIEEGRAAEKASRTTENQSFPAKLSADSL